MSNLIPSVGIFVWLSGGIVLLCVGIYVYRNRIWPLMKKQFDSESVWKKMDYLVAYVPSEESRAIHHIIAGVCISIGVCIVIAIPISLAITRYDDGEFDSHHIIFEASGILFAILISAISFWTLWQTKKIEHLQGEDITQFHTLITKMNKKMQDIVYDYNIKNHKIASEHHRVFLITTNPFFGILSYQNDQATNDFSNVLNALREIAREGSIKFSLTNDHEPENNKISNSPSKDIRRFKFEIICGNETAIKKFHEKFYSEKTISTDNIFIANEMTEQRLAEFTKIPGIVTRVKEVPQFPQFAIIGNTLFEFILDTVAPYTEVRETHIVDDKRRCSMYEETFNLLKKTLDK